MNVVEQDVELGFTLFKTPASFLINADLIPSASSRYGGSERYRCLDCSHFSRMVLILGLLKVFMGV